MPLPELKSDRLTLRQLRRSDAVSLQKHADDRKVVRWLAMLPSPYTLENAYDWVKTTHRFVRKDTSYPFGIQLNETKEIIGMIGYHEIDRRSMNMELGYWLGRKYWRLGLMSEAIESALGFAFNELGMQRIYARVMPKNIGSAMLLEKCGFSYEGCARQSIKVRKRWYDLQVYAILKNEFRH